MNPLTIPLALAGLWCLSAIAFVFIVIREILRFRKEPVSVPPSPRRFAPDPCFADRALAEDEQVESLDAIWELPAKEPSR